MSVEITVAPSTPDGHAFPACQAPELDGVSSGFCRELSPPQLGDRPALESSIEESVWELSIEFSSSATLLTRMCGSNVANGRIVQLDVEDFANRPKSLSSTKAILKQIRGIIARFVGNRAETERPLAGEKPLVLLRDYLESLEERGRDAPGAANHALSVWSATVGIGWPLSDGLIAAAVSVGPSESPKQAPAIRVSTLRAI